MLNKGQKPRNRKKCADGGCLFARRSQLNAVSLNTVLTEGDYVITVFADLIGDEEQVLRQVGSFDVSLHVAVESLVAKEDRFNCEAGRLPDSLDFLMDSEGFLRFSDWVFADFTKKKQSTVFTVDKASVLRVVSVEPKGVDVDLSLFSKGNLLGRSNAVGGSEGLVHELEKGTYYLDISFENSFIDDSRLKFCETVLIEIGVSPQEAVLKFNSHFDLNSCQDTTDDLAKWFTSIKDSISKEKVQLNPSNTFYTLPLINLVESEQEIYSVSFTVPKLLFSYFEIHSDFVTAGLTIALAKVSKKGENLLQGSDDALNLGEHTRKVFSQVLNPGKYKFKILSSATAKSLSSDGETYSAGYSQEAFKVLQKCVAFQMKIRLIPTSAKSMENWECRDTDFRLLPKTMNTLDRLGTKDTPAGILPAATYFSSAVAAPNSFKNVTDSSSFYLESQSLIRILVESEDTPMVLTLFKGDDVLAEVKDQKPNIYEIQSVLDQHSTYKFQVAYFPNSARCQTYSILLQIIPTSRLTSDLKSCKESQLTDNFINERLMELGGIFELIIEDGLSSVTLEPEFTFKQGKKPYKGEIPLEVTADNALVTGHLASNFAKAGLVMFIKSDSEVIEWGSYKSPHRYELEPIPLATGSYKLVIKELAASPLASCVSYKGSLVMEDIAFWNSASSMIRTTQACVFPDLPETLNVVGLIENNRLELHQTLMMDTYLAQSFIDFEVTEPVVFSFAVAPVSGIQFTVKLYKYSDDEPVLLALNSVSGLLEKASYLVEVLYDSEFGLPSAALCPSFDVTLAIIPESEFNSQLQSRTCSSQDLPSTLGANYNKDLQISGRLEKMIKVVLEESSELNFFTGFEFVYSGTVHMELVDKFKKVLKKSTPEFGFSHLSLSVPTGEYYLKIWNDKSFKDTCWGLAFSFSHVFSESCKGGVLPDSLDSDEAGPYGGPQLADGSISFNGRFSFDKAKPEQSVKFRADQDSIVRIMTASYGSFRIESAVYDNNFFSNPIGYSKNKSKFGSFVFQVTGRETPYFLILNHIVEDGRGCMVYDLTISVKPVTTVFSHLKCKLVSHDKALPPVSFDLSGPFIYENTDLAIFDKWMIGDKLPEGIQSSGKKNSKFIYESTLKVSKPGSLNIEAVYDFLTNDLSLEIWNEDSVLGSSFWTTSAYDESKEFPLIASLLEDISLPIGTYRLILTQGLVSNHLIQKFQDQSSCFPFELSLEFSPKTSTKLSKLNSVIPTELQAHNTLSPLILSLKFSRPVDLKELVLMLKSDKEKDSIEPDELTVDSDSASRLRAKFKAGSLKPNVCYELYVEGEKLQTDGLSHKYCTWPCRCNPAAEAKCEDFDCKCPAPYIGDDCFDCEVGFYMDRNVCVNMQDDDPRVVSVKVNVEEPIKRNQQLRLYVTLTSAPYAADKEKVTRASPQALIDSFYLKSKESTIKAFTAMPLVKGDTRWVLRFASGDLEYGAVYIVQQVQGFIFTSSGQEFKFGSAQEIRVEVAVKVDNEAECSGHGIEEAMTCVCDKGYRGLSCELCASGYYKTVSSTCEEITSNIEADPSAHVVSIVPSRPSTIISQDPVFVTIELSQKAFTDEGLLIDSLGNMKFMQQAFVLQKGVSESFVLAKNVKSVDKEGLKWSLEFDSREMEVSRTYKLAQLEMALFTEKKKVFAKPEIEMPRFRVIERLDCGVGRQDAGVCVCPKEFSGSSCQDCAKGFFKNLVGECVAEVRNSEQVVEDEEIGVFGTIVYCVLYFVIGMVFVYLVGKLRGKSSGREDFEMVKRNKKKEEEEDIDLYR